MTNHSCMIKHFKRDAIESLYYYILPITIMLELLILYIVIDCAYFPVTHLLLFALGGVMIVFYFIRGIQSLTDYYRDLKWRCRE